MTDKSAAAVRELAEKYFPIREFPNATDFYKKMQTEMQKQFISDLTALIEEHYHPKEFVEWLINNSDKRIHRRTTDELYQYWEENVR